MKDLKRLGLDDTQVTDAGLAQVREMTGLEILSLCGTRMTKAGLANLKVAVPKTYILAEGIPNL
jgi:hypothetical protein